MMILNDGGLIALGFLFGFLFSFFVTIILISVYEVIRERRKKQKEYIESLSDKQTRDYYRMMRE